MGNRRLLLTVIAVGSNIAYLTLPAHAQPDKREMLMAGCIYVEEHKPDASHEGMSVAEYCEAVVEEICEEHEGC